MRVPYVNIPRQNENLKRGILAAVDQVLSHGNFILGPEVAELEKKVASLCGTRFAVAVNSGTDALVLALRASSVCPGDEVITVSHSFVATASAICLVGAVPVFVDVAEDQNIDISQIEKAVTNKTKAIIPVHLTGHPARIDEIVEIAKKHRLAVIEDAAQALGADYKGKRIGNWGDFGCISFHPLKNLSACGDGGMITTNNEEAAARLRIFRNIGLQDRDTCVDVSGNSRLDTLQAAILQVKLEKLEDVTKIRRAHAARYDKRLSSLVKTPPLGAGDVFHLYVIQTERREELIAHLTAKGVETKIHYPRAIHQQPAFASVPRRFPLPVTERLTKTILSLPVDHTLSSEQIDYAADTVAEFFTAKVRHS